MDVADEGLREGCLPDVALLGKDEGRWAGCLLC